MRKDEIQDRAYRHVQGMKRQDEINRRIYEIVSSRGWQDICNLAAYRLNTIDSVQDKESWQDVRDAQIEREKILSFLQRLEDIARKYKKERENA